MRSLLTGYAGAFNRRYRRIGHLFQNRYRSTVVEEEPYLLELVRYIHLNPIRAQIVRGLRELERYPWTGHSALLGGVSRAWQAAAPILEQFGPTVARARQAYREFVADGIARGRRPELQGGGLIRSAGGWAAVVARRREREAYVGDARVLGGSDFVEALYREVRPRAPVPAAADLDVICALVCRHVNVVPETLRQGGRKAAISRARAGIAYLWVERLGHAGRPLAPYLGIHPAVVYQAARRGAREAETWERVLRISHKTT
jgi:hypothetical protein